MHLRRLGRRVLDVASGTVTHVSLPPGGVAAGWRRSLGAAPSATGENLIEQIAAVGDYMVALTRVVGNDCAVRLIGERVAVTVAAGEVHIRHGVREVAVHKQSEGRRLRIVDSAHLDGVAGRDGAVCRPEIAAPTVPSSSPPPSLLRPLAEYEAVIGGSF